MRTAARKDNNHNEIAKAFERLGWSVLHVYQLPSCCDIFVGKAGHTYAVEIKDHKKIPSKRRLTKGEQEFKDTWRGRWALVESVEDVLELNQQLFKN